MIIRSLTLQNYRRFRQESIEFPDGIFGIVGKNGAGKSTIIEAIGWAIYGAYAPRTGQDLIKREGAEPDSDCRVELEFLLDSNTYRVVRELRGRTQSPRATLYVNGGAEPEVTGTHAVIDFLSRRIGMDYNSFFTSVFAKQKELNALSDLRPAERKKRIMRLLRIDKIDTAIELVRADKRATSDLIEGIKSTLKDLDVLQIQLTDLKGKRMQAGSNLQNLRNRLQDAKQKVSSASKLKDEQERKYNKYQKLDARLNVMNERENNIKKNLQSDSKTLDELKKSKSQLIELRPKIKPYASIKNKKEKFDRAREKFLGKSHHLNNLRDSKQHLGKLLKEKNNVTHFLRKSAHLESQLSNVEKKIGKKETNERSLRDQISSKLSLVSQHKKRLKELETHYSHIKNLGPSSKCPTCKRLLGDYFPDLVERFEKEILKAKKAIALENKTIVHLKKKLANTTKYLNNFKLKKKQINKQLHKRSGYEQKRISLLKQIKEELEKIANIKQSIKRIGPIRYDEMEHNRVKSLFAEITGLREKAIGLKKDLTRIPKVESSIRRLTRQLKTIAKKQEAIRSAIVSLGFKQDEYKQAVRNYNFAIDERHKKEKDVINARNDLKAIINEIKRTDKEISEEGQKRKRIEREGKKIEILSALDKLFGEFKVDLISRIRPILSVRASELLRKLTDGKYPNMHVNEDYDILIEDAGKTFVLNRFSGGEEDLANLCLRIAISQVISERSGTSLNFIVLDEIFGSQDEMRRSKIIKALMDLSNQFRQIVLITHVEDVKDALPYTLNVIENSDGTSKIEIEGEPKLSL